MFRLTDNVPHVYANESRDFQLLCRIFDAAFGSVKYSTDSLHHASDTSACNDAVIDLLRYKLGLFKELSCTPEQLRSILQVFPILVRNKGSIQGVSYVLNLFHRLFGQGNHAPEFNIYSVAEDQCLEIVFPYDLSNTQLLVELLYYVVPAGLKANMNIVVATRPVITLSMTDRVEVQPRSATNSNVIDPTAENSSNLNELIATVGLTAIIDETEDI